MALVVVSHSWKSIKEERSRLRKIRIWMAIDRPMEATATIFDQHLQALVQDQLQNPVEMVEFKVDLV